MITPEEYEDFFHTYMSDLTQWAPDGIIDINLAFLHSIGLLRCRDYSSDITRSLTDYFHVVESREKITLHNQQFMIWIVPKVEGGLPKTFTLITYSGPDGPELEVVFCTTGIYNAPRLILRILDYFLKDIEENEALISQMK